MFLGCVTCNFKNQSPGFLYDFSAFATHRIVKRREARARLKIPKERKRYQHESRHLHALNRARGKAGKFYSSEGNMKVEEEDFKPPVKKRIRYPKAEARDAKEGGEGDGPTAKVGRGYYWDKNLELELNMNT